MYVAVKGGEKAIANAHQLLAERRRGNGATPAIMVDQIEQQLELAVARVMSEGALYDTQLASLALKQAMGDAVEAIFLLRAYRTTLPRFGYSLSIDTADMRLLRRISATYKDIPGGQLLGPTFDYTHRLLDFSLMASACADADDAPVGKVTAQQELEPQQKQSDDVQAVDSQQVQNLSQSESAPHVLDLIAKQGLMKAQPSNEHIGDLTREPLDFPTDRSMRLQTLARADEGFLLALGYSTQRGYGRTHPFAGEIRIGHVEIIIEVEELDFPICIGEILVSECEMINQFAGNQQSPPQFTRGYGLSFGYAERKAMAMALVDRSLQAEELGEPTDSPAAHAEFVLAHADNVEASGFVSHLKLPHYVDFQSELELIRRMTAAFGNESSDSDTSSSHNESKSTSHTKHEECKK